MNFSYAVVASSIRPSLTSCVSAASSCFTCSLNDPTTNDRFVPICQIDGSNASFACFPKFSNADPASFAPNPNRSNFGFDNDKNASTLPLPRDRFTSDPASWSVGGFAVTAADDNCASWSARTATPTTAVAFPSADKAVAAPAAVTPSCPNAAFAANAFGTIVRTAPPINVAAVAAAPNPSATFKIGAGMSPRASTIAVPACTTSRSRSLIDPPDLRTTSSTAPPNRSMSPDRLSVRIAAFCAANPARRISLRHCSIPAEPFRNTMFAARTASAPNRMFIAAARASGDRPAIDSCNRPAYSVIPTKFPFASYADRPRASIVFDASSDCGVSRCSIVLSDVPASEPVMPADANAVRVPTVSSMDRPVAFATRPAWFSAMLMSWTEPCALFAPAASRSAMCGMSLPDRPNCVIADAAVSAASPTSICPAAASDRAPFSPPLRMSAVDTPALASSLMPSAASLPEYWVAPPSSIALSRNACNAAPVAPVLAATPDMALSKSLYFFTTTPMPAAMAAPATSIPRPAASMC